MTLLDDVLKTINYSLNFGGQLSLEQLWFRLLSSKRYSLEEVKTAIKNYELKITNYKENKENSKKVKLAEELVEKHLFKFKDILMVGVTGSVAAENARKEEDIDLFLVCRKDTLWITRLKLRIYIRLMNIPHRRYGQRENPNDFCFNLWMDESDLMVPKMKQNEKNAVDLIMMKVLLNRNQVYEKLISSNSWAKDYVANGYHKLVTSNKKLVTRKNKTSIILRYLNYLSYIGQIAYMRLKGPIKFINLKQAFFHK